MRTLTMLTVLALSTVGAVAQFTINPSPPQSSAFGAEPIVRITVALRAPVIVTEPQGVLDTKALEAARRTLYGMAEGECATLSETFKAECRLSSLSIVNAIVTPANAPPPNVMNATAVYELKPRGTASGR
jgi:hypothetical protein